MSKDKYSSIFLKPNGGYCVHYIILQIFFATHTKSVSLSYVNHIDWLPTSEHSFRDFRTGFASVKEHGWGKKYSMSVRGKHTFLIS